MSQSLTDPRLAFIGENFDELSELTRQFQIIFFYGDQTIELTESKTKKIFLKRIKVVPKLQRQDFFIGSCVVVFGRVFKLVSYGDLVTKQLCEALSEVTVALVKDCAFSKMGNILSILNVEGGFTFRGISTGTLSKKEAELSNLIGDAIPMSFLDVPGITVIELVRENAVEKAQDMVQRIEPIVGKNSLWVCQSQAQANEAASILLSIARKNTSADLSQENGRGSVLVLKPHIVSSKLSGDVLNAVMTTAPSLRIQSIGLFSISSFDANEFLIAYKGVLPDYSDAVQQLAAGPCIVVQFTNIDERSAVSVVRGVCGPFDVVIARKLQAATIRAKFGSSRVLNAVHCTDLEDAGEFEAQFFFHHMACKAPPTV